jgi:MFS family permease
MTAQLHTGHQGPADTRQLGPAFNRLWCSSGLSNLADGIVKVALPLVAIRYTQSPTVIAGLTFALTLPWLVCALPAGALADRLDRRRSMLAANLVRTGLLGGSAALLAAGLGSIWLLYLIAVCLGIAETIYDTSAQSILPQLVERDQLSRANSRLFAAELTANQFVGPPLGGVLVAAGAALSIAVPGALWMVAIGALLMVRGSYRFERTTASTMRADIAEGLRYLWRNRVLRTLAMMTGLFNLATNATFGVLVLYAVGPASAMRLSDGGYGLLFATLAVGSLLGSFLAGPVERMLGRAGSLALSYGGGAVLVGVLAVTANPFLIGAGFVIGSIGLVIGNVIAVSLRQRIAPGRLLGRVNSGYRLVAWGTMPLGAVLGGLLAQLVGFRVLFALMSVLILSLLGFMTVLTNRNLDAAESAGRPA